MPRGVRTVNENLLSAALEGLEAQKSRIEDQIRQVRSMLGQRGPAKRAAAPAAAAAERPAAGGGRRQLSPAARRRIAAAQKRRWAEYRKKSAKTGGKEKE